MINSEKISYWELKSFFSEIDHLIIGAGIVGYSTALQLKNRFPSAKILLIERGFLPSGASTKNAGFACFGSATELQSDLDKMDVEGVFRTVERRWQGLQLLRKTFGDSVIDFHCHGSWDLITDPHSEIYLKSKENLQEFNRELKSITGISQVYSEDTMVSEKFGFKNVPTSFYNKLEGQIDTAAMNKAFYQKVIAAGINVLFGIKAESINATTYPIVDTNFGKISAKHVFICTNGFARTFLPDADVQPARAQVLITKPLSNLRLRGTFHYQEGYYYFRNIDDRILLGGGRNLDFIGETTEDLDITSNIQLALEKLLREVILPNEQFEVDHRWAGVMGVGRTKSPIVTEVDNNVFCGIRLGGMGVAIGSLVGKELAELIK